MEAVVLLCSTYFTINKPNVVFLMDDEDNTRHNNSILDHSKYQ